MLWWLVATVGATVPDDVRPVLLAQSPADRYSAWRQRQGLPGQQLACAAAGPPGISVCFRRGSSVHQRWVHQPDLEAWRVTVAELRSVVARRAVAEVGRAESVPVVGTPHRYLRATDEQGWAAAAVLAPQAVVERLGGAFRLAVPAQGLVVAYRLDGADLDRIMAVGVRELYESQPRSITPSLFTWESGGWRGFGEAVPR